jgi:signal peptidase I
MRIIKIIFENELIVMNIKKILEIIKRILYIIAIICFIIYITVIILPIVTNGNATLAGYRIFVVASGSMIPDYNVGDIVICKKIEEEDIKIDDVIIYLGNSGDFDGKVVMHKIVSIGTDENGEKYFESKGIANDVTDPEVRYSQIYGRVTTQSTIMTKVYKLVNNMYFSYIVITLVVINVFISFLPKRKRIELIEACSKESVSDKKKIESKSNYNIAKDDIQNNGVQNNNIQDGNMQNEDTQNNSIQDSNIQNDGMQNNSIQDSNIQNDGLPNNNIQDSNMQNYDMLNNSTQDSNMQNDDMLNNNNQDGNIQNDGTQNNNNQDGNIPNDDIHTDEIQNSDIQNNEIKIDKNLKHNKHNDEKSRKNKKNNKKRNK